ncbi:Conidiation protein 6-domain-containing protein [Crepidotus variabilis]|uniref:Conidiation protein 6-domain-containing protein n=1 Tax=Crepidotus variabilis TaxID=179855 RepID=A0A9P6E2W5_9AGAR|nr:Conidiation protein 6-domain-containing protein [Crepidotus variabilis]
MILNIRKSEPQKGGRNLYIFWKVWEVFNQNRISTLTINQLRFTHTSKFTMSSTRQAGGFKAAMHNPNVTEEGKQAAAEKLQNLKQSGELESTTASRTEGKNEGNVIGGYKATLKNPNVSEEAKDHAKEILEEHGVDA